MLRPRLLAVLTAVVVATAAPAQQPTGTTPAYPNDLAVGPFPATLAPAYDTSKSQEENTARPVEVRFITKQQVVTWEKNVVKVYEAKKVWSVAALTTDGKEDTKRVWRLNKQTGEMAREQHPTLPLNQLPSTLPPPINTTLNPVTDKQLSVYLLLRAERLHRLVDWAIDRRDKAGAGDLVRFGGRLREVARAKGLPREIADLYALDRYVADQFTHLERQDATLKTLRDIKLNADQQVQAAFRDGVRWSARRIGAGGDARDIVDEAAVFDERKEWIEEQAKLLADEPQREFREAVAARAADRAGLVRRLDQAAGALRIDPGVFTRLEDFAKQFAANRDDAGAADLLSARADLAANAAAGRRFPLLECDILRLKARVLDAGPVADRVAQAEKMMALSRTAEAAARDVPDLSEFVGDRVEVLTTAAELAHRAVTVGHGPRLWSMAYDPRAEYGVRLADQALKYGPLFDPAGRARAVRAWCLFQRGMYQDAAVQGKEIGELRKSDPTTQYNLARVYGRVLSGRSPKDCQPAADYLERAIGGGFYNMADAKTDPDLNAAKNTPGWKNLRTANVEGVMEASAGTGGQTRFILWLHNKSRFALKDVDVSYAGRVKVGRDWVKYNRAPKIGYLPAGEKFPIDDLPPGNDIDLAPSVTLTSPISLVEGSQVTVTVRRGQAGYVPLWLRANPFPFGGF